MLGHRGQTSLAYLRKRQGLGMSRQLLEALGGVLGALGGRLEGVLAAFWRRLEGSGRRLGGS